MLWITHYNSLVSLYNYITIKFKLILTYFYNIIDFNIYNFINLLKITNIYYFNIK